MTDASTNDLITNLRFHTAWITICERYIRLRPKFDVAAFLKDMLETEREIIELLAAALRDEGVPPGQIGSQEQLVDDAFVRRNERTRLQFIDTGLTRSLAWYDDRIADADDPHHELWRELCDLQQAVAASASALLSQIKPSN